MDMWFHRKKGVCTPMLLDICSKDECSSIIQTCKISHLFCIIVTITVLKQSGSTVRGKDAPIDPVNMFSLFSTWPPFAL